MRQIQDSVFRFTQFMNTKRELGLAPLGNCYLDDKNVVYSKNVDFAFSCGLELFLKKRNDSAFIKLNTGSRNTPNYLSWSFDGKKILYTDDLMGSNDVYAIDIETQNIENLTQSDSNDERGDLSPDGKLLVFSSNRHNPKDQDLFILNLETRAIENITNSSGYDLIGRWDLDGKSILFGSNKDGNWEIYRYILADKSTIRLTENDAFDGDPRVR
jgi:Tol biopolymer transport system component